MRLYTTIFVVLFMISQLVAGSRYNSNYNRTKSEEDFQSEAPNSPVCSKCECSSTPTRCPPGVSLLLDGCSCCKVCARQLEDACDFKRVCDVHKKLYCDEESQTCKARPGRSCNVGGHTLANGDAFKPSCRVLCSCIDGDLGCIPTCTTPLSSPASLRCPHPRLIRRRGSCCGEWVCLKKGKLKKDMIPFENQVKGHQKHKVTFRDGCMVQTTPWSPCSKTCGFGISDRVTNDNKDCKMKKEMRLCNLRPCSLMQRRASKKKRCRKNIRHNKRVQFSLSGCLSAEIYRPRYCGVCAGKCCDPKVTKTVKVEFICKSENDETSSFTRNMMIIRKCHCHQCLQSNSIFSSAFSGLTGDTFRQT